MKSMTLLLVGLLALSTGVAAQVPTVSVCADLEPTPAGALASSAAGQEGTKPTSFAFAFAQAAFTRLGAKVTTTILPWSRCMKAVEDGSIDFAIGAYYDKERANRFTYSIAYQILTPQVYFVAARPVSVRTVVDLKKYRGCGMLGASYAHYGLMAADLDLGVNSFKQMIDKLKAGRCDYFVEELEVVAGLRDAKGQRLREPALRSAPVPGAKPPGKHLITANSNGAAKLIPALNAAIDDLVRSGRAAEMWRQHEGATPYRPER